MGFVHDLTGLAHAHAIPTAPTVAHALPAWDQNMSHVFSKSGHKKLSCNVVCATKFCPHAEWALKIFPIKCHFLLKFCAIPLLEYKQAQPLAYYWGFLLIPLLNVVSQAHMLENSHMKMPLVYAHFRVFISPLHGAATGSGIKFTSRWWDSVAVYDI